MKSLIAGIIAAGAFTVSFAASVEQHADQKVVQPVQRIVVEPVIRPVVYNVFGNQTPKQQSTAGVVETLTKPIVRIIGAKEADSLVVVSQRDEDCTPCKRQHVIVNQLVKDGYDVKIVLKKDFKGSVRKTPTLFYYNGKKNIDIHEGTQSYEEITKTLKKPTIL